MYVCNRLIKLIYIILYYIPIPVKVYSATAFEFKVPIFSFRQDTSKYTTMSISDINDEMSKTIPEDTADNGM